jgi:hypothetical protein
MTGVEILATQEVATAFAFNWVTFWILASAVFVILFICGILLSIRDGDYLGVIIFLIAGILCGFLFGALVGKADAVPVEYETQYKVTVSDEVEMNEFFEKYEIIKQDGKIYTVREK